MKTMIVWTAPLLIAIGCAQADEGKAQQGQLMLSAFECASFAEMAEKDEENKRLFNVGYQAGHNFLDALEHGKIPEADVYNTVPVLVMAYVRGPKPSIDFVIGEIYTAAEFDANNRVNKDNVAEKGRTIQEAEETEKIHAENAYANDNCELLRLPAD